MQLQPPGCIPQAAWEGAGPLQAEGVWAGVLPVASPTPSHSLLGRNGVKPDQHKPFLRSGMLSWAVLGGGLRPGRCRTRAQQASLPLCPSLPWESIAQTQMGPLGELNLELTQA